jgi:predicted PurR-regulated permease PerM
VDKKTIAIICLSALVLIMGGIVGYMLRPADDGVSTAIDYIRWAERENHELRNLVDRAGERIDGFERNATDREQAIQDLESLAASRQDIIERLTGGSQTDRSTLRDLRELTETGRGIVERLIKAAQSGTD